MQHSGISEARFGRCPRCKSTELHPSRHRNMLERACSRFIAPWRCNLCFARFFRPFWFKAEPRKEDVRKHFDKGPARGGPQAKSTSVSTREEPLPGFIKRNPALAFLIPTRGHVRNVKHTVPVGTK